MDFDFDVADSVARGDASAVEAWLAQGNRLDAPLRERPLSALHLMARRDSWAPWLQKNAQALIDKGLDIDARAVGAALSPLTEACASNRLQMARVLLSLGADSNGAGAPQGGPLHFCPDSVEFLRALLAAGADINLPNRFGKTPLRHWVDNKHSLDFANAALDAGADPTLRCDLGETPLRVAMEMDLEGWTRAFIAPDSETRSSRRVALGKFEDLACIDPQTGCLSEDADPDGLPDSLGLMLERLASGAADARNRAILLLNLAGPEECARAMVPSETGGITPALEIAARKGHFQMAAKFIKTGACWTGPASPNAPEPRPLSAMGVLGICLWHSIQSNAPMERGAHGKLALFLAKKCAMLPEAWKQLCAEASDLSALGPYAAEARDQFEQLRATMEKEAIRLSLPTSVSRPVAVLPRRVARRL